MFKYTLISITITSLCACGPSNPQDSGQHNSSSFTESTTPDSTANNVTFILENKSPYPAWTWINENYNSSENLTNGWLTISTLNGKPTNYNNCLEYKTTALEQDCQETNELCSGLESRSIRLTDIVPLHKATIPFSLLTASRSENHCIQNQEPQEVELEVCWTFTQGIDCSAGHGEQWCKQTIDKQCATEIIHVSAGSTYTYTIK